MSVAFIGRFFNSQNTIKTDLLIRIYIVTDSMLRVFMVWEASDAYQEIEPQEFHGFDRNGFTVVEWGGTEVSKQ